MRGYLSFFYLFLFVPFAYTSDAVSDSLLIDAVDYGDIPVFTDYLDQGIDVNAFYGDDEFTLLAYSIEAGHTSITELLIQAGADVEQICDRKTPLMFAAKYNRPDVIPLLLSAGANINSINRAKNSAMHYAAKYGNLEIIEVLSEMGASLNLQNSDEWTPMDYSIINKRGDIEDYLASHGGVIFKKNLPSFFDGPHMEIMPDEHLRVFYLVHDSIEQNSYVISESYAVNNPHYEIAGFAADKNRNIIEKESRPPPLDFVDVPRDNIEQNSYVISESYAVNNPHYEIAGLAGDENRYIIEKESRPPPSDYIDVPRILAIGDIHGQYSRMIKTLKNAGIIDENLQWQWGDGHLVFTGDIFDRGSNVTECLWFIYNLEKQADRQNGKVHLLLGNHEIMILEGDLRYISNRYYGITTNLDMDYSLLYDRNTVLGRWLRSKNTIEKINNLIFLHAGISPQFAAKNISIDSANFAIRAFLNGFSDTYPEELNDFLTGNRGPVWYRGYTNNSRYNPRITPSQLSEILSRYEAETFIVGHTETDSIKSFYNSAVIDINIPLWNKNVPEQALLIENGKFYVISLDGSRKQIN